MQTLHYGGGWTVLILHSWKWSAPPVIWLPSKKILQRSFAKLITINISSTPSPTLAQQLPGGIPLPLGKDVQLRGGFGLCRSDGSDLNGEQ